MFCDVGQVFISGIGGPNGFVQGSEAIVSALILTTMQRMSHLVRRLCPSPDIALESIGQTTLGLRYPSKRREATSTNPSL
jgi:hypothetical protein